MRRAFRIARKAFKGPFLLIASVLSLKAFHSPVTELEFDQLILDAVQVVAEKLPSTKAFRCKEKRTYEDYFFHSQSKEDKQLLFGKEIHFDQICGGTYVSADTVATNCQSK